MVLNLVLVIAFHNRATVVSICRCRIYHQHRTLSPPSPMSWYRNKFRGLRLDSISLYRLKRVFLTVVT